MAEAKYVWQPHPKKVFAIAKVIDGSTLECEDGERLENSKKGQIEIGDRESLEKDYPDLVLCEELSNPSIVYGLEKRLKASEIHTFVGDIVIVMNPFVRLPVYTNELIQHYLGTAEAHFDRGQEVPSPHVFYTTDDAIYQLWSTQQSQSIIISGESGAGKTESAKQVLHFIGDTCGAPVEPGQLKFEDVIMQASPILEAYGNARTKRNDNSSRFGKYCNVYFDDRTRKICGCGNIPYLLEKSRVVFQDKGERNFHCFYNLLRGDTPHLAEIRRKCQLPGGGAPLPVNGGIDTFQFLNQSGCIDLPTKNDVEDYLEMEQACKDLGLDDTAIWENTCAILYMGNMKFFDSKTNKEAKSPDQFVKVDAKQCAFTAHVVRIFGLNELQLINGMCCKMFQKQAMPQKLSVAKNNLLTFSKFVFDRLFTYLVTSINESMMRQSNGRVTKHSIGILDIFGFEKFDKNSLEQLCINFTNERLQFQFNTFVFAQEKKIYAEEQLDMKALWW
jgi:myosin heavy subunit